MLENIYEGLNAQPKVYLSKEYFCEMYPTCVSSKLCEFILLGTPHFFNWPGMNRFFGLSSMILKLFIGLSSIILKLFRAQLIIYQKTKMIFFS